MKAHILVVDDDVFMAKILSFVLSDNGYQTSVLPDPAAVAHFLDEHVVSLILLDVMLPYTDGLSLCATIRRQYPDLPIIFVSARAQLADKVAGFNRGADDYVTKPFEPMELLVRIDAVLRRRHRVDRSACGMVLKVGRATLDVEGLRFLMPGREPVALTPTEMKILECLMRNANAVISRETLIARVWGYDVDGGENRVNVYIRRLREKFDADPEVGGYIQTVRGMGYTFRDRRCSPVSSDEAPLPISANDGA
jgi:two-component system response regulator RegX3